MRVKPSVACAVLDGEKDPCVRGIHGHALHERLDDLHLPTPPPRGSDRRVAHRAGDPGGPAAPGHHHPCRSRATRSDR